MSDWAVRALEAGDWPVIEGLFGPRGACAGCWCMYWRVAGGAAWAAGKGEGNKAAFRALVESGGATGVLAFGPEGGAVGWCAVGPRGGFERVLRSRALARVGAGEREGPTRGSAAGAGGEGGGPRGAAAVDAGVWSLNCFYIPAKWRGRGVARALLAGAVELAFQRGAREVEAYPVAPPASGGRHPAVFAYTGPLSMFEAAGFERVESGGRRPVVVRRR